MKRLLDVKADAIQRVLVDVMVDVSTRVRVRVKMRVRGVSIRVTIPARTLVKL